MSDMDFFVAREPFVEKCTGCERIEGAYCKMYMMPHSQWTRVGGCAARTHTKEVKPSTEFKLNPLKASKRAMEVKK
jgi:hypothetical protein